MTGYIGFGNDMLDKQPKVNKGDLIWCPSCEGKHPLEAGKSDGKESHTLYFYKCGNDSYLGAVAQRLVAGLKPCCSGSI